MQHTEKVKVVHSYLKNVILKANGDSVEKLGHVPLFKGIRLLLNFPEPVRLQSKSNFSSKLWSVENCTYVRL